MRKSIAIRKRGLIVSTRGLDGTSLSVGGQHGASPMVTRGFSRLAAAIVFLDGMAAPAHPQAEAFTPVWATMTQQEGGTSPGCRGCHIGPAPAFGPWFGNTELDVLRYFLSGQGRVLVAGGRQSALADALGLVEGSGPFMPLFAPIDGRFWVDDPDQGLTELTDLGSWLDTIDF